MLSNAVGPSPMNMAEQLQKQRTAWKDKANTKMYKKKKILSHCVCASFINQPVFGLMRNEFTATVSTGAVFTAAKLFQGFITYLYASEEEKHPGNPLLSHNSLIAHFVFELVQYHIANMIRCSDTTSINRDACVIYIMIFLSI